MGWRITGSLPENINKYIFVVAPHTSNWDFFIGVFVRGIMRFKSNFLAKKSLFVGPLGRIMRSMGGQEVDRSQKGNMVEQVVEIFNQKEEFRIAIAPEGTRKKVDEWKTGFYHIARMAQIPLILTAFDWGKKEVRFSAPFYTGADMEKDMDEIKRFFSSAKGRFHERLDR